MNLFDQLKGILERSLHVRPNQLKHAPFVKPGQEAAAAKDLNAVTSTAIQVALAAGPGAATHMLHVRPEQLKGVSGVVDHNAAADFVNNHVQSVLTGSSTP